MIGASRASSTRDYIVLSTTNITSTGSQNYTVPAGVVFIEIEMWGGGGGGGNGRTVSGGRGGGTTHQRGGGGGGGAYVKHKIHITQLVENAAINFTVGAGGAGNGSGSGADGADTTLNNITAPGGGSVVSLSGPSAGGGGGGHAAGMIQTGSEAGSASDGNITNTDGSAGGARDITSVGFIRNGGDGGDAGNGGEGGDGGTNSAASQDGTTPGGGGGGGASQTNTAGADGADGKVIIKAFG